MRQKGKRAASETDDLQAPLLERALAGQAQNASQGSAVLVGSDGAGANEVIEMSDFATARGGYRRRRGEGRGNADAVEDAALGYVWHKLEPHHTLAGIALQYRVTISQLKSANQIVNEQELVTRSKIMIPTNKHGTLYNYPEEYVSKDVGSVTHTTANPSKASNDDFEDGQKNTFVVDVASNGGGTAENDVHKNLSAEYLATIDTQMQSAIRSLDTTLKKQESANDQRSVMYRAQPQQSWEIQFSSWRVAVVALSTVLLVSFSTVYFYRYVSAPEPHA